MDQPVGTPAYGRRLLPVTIDQIAATQPDRAWASLPRTDTDLSQGYVEVTYRAFAKAINEVSWLIEKHFGRSENFETIAYLGMPDIRYYMLQMAAAKTGYQILFSSHNNSLAQHLALMGSTKCTTLLSASSVEVKDILDARPMLLLVVPELEDLLDADTDVEHYPFSKTFDEASNDPYLILHTSGSIGNPKTFLYRHGGMAAVDRQRALPNPVPVSGFRRRLTVTHPGPCRFFCPFQPFHAGCSVAIMCSTVLGGATLVPGFRHKAVTRDDLIDIMEHAHIESAMLPPGMLEHIAADPRAPEYLKRMSCIYIAGAPLSKAVGTVVSRYCDRGSQYGCTENLCAVNLMTDPEDFEYNSWDIKHSGIEFKPVDDTGDLHELILHRTPDSHPYIGYFHNCPEEQVFRPGDLWRPHPDPRKASHTWKYAGRSDDLIAYHHGEKLHPTAYELKHSEHPFVRNTVICGTGHAQPVLLIELQEPDVSADEKLALLENLWAESIQVVNRVAPKTGQIAKTHVIIGKTEKPFERSVKGTVARKATIKRYEEEIEQVYQCYGDQAAAMSERN